MTSMHRLPGDLAVALAVTLALGVGCKKSEKPADAVQSTEAAAATSAAPAAAGAALSGLDECVVGKWKADKVSLKLDQVSAEGGSGVALEVQPSGDSVIDFSPMSDIHASAQGGVNFDFKYGGKASGKLKTPTRGTLSSEGSKFDDLRVTANVKLPGAGSVPLFKDTPVKELAGMATAIAGAVPNLPKAAAAPAAVPNPAQGIDSNPVFSSGAYSCQGDSLKLSNAVSGATWAFTRTH